MERIKVGEPRNPSPGTAVEWLLRILWMQGVRLSEPREVGGEGEAPEK